MLICVKTCPADQYPVLTVSHLELQDTLGHATHRFFENDEDAILFANFLATPSERFKMVRRAAYCAGVTKMENAVYERVWASLVELIRCLLLPACEELVGMYSCPVQIHGRKQVLGIGQTIGEVPPLPVQRACIHCGTCTDAHTPVPRQIERAAKELLPSFPVKIYTASSWLARNDAEMKNEILQARSDYIWEEEGAVENDERGGEDDTEGPSRKRRKRYR